MAVTVGPVLVAVAAMVSRMTWWPASGRARQFRVVWQNSRCSILFHFDVPGGKWQQVISRPVSRPARRPGLPRPGPAAVRAAGVRGDQQPPRARVAARALGLPPAAQRFHPRMPP